MLIMVNVILTLFVEYILQFFTHYNRYIYYYSKLTIVKVMIIFYRKFSIYKTNVGATRFEIEKIARYDSPEMNHALSKKQREWMSLSQSQFDDTFAIIFLFSHKHTHIYPLYSYVC